ncbi:hypothetical protein H5T51_09690 [Candidatus Bathyarchaeota archaeon]|nr:hypothetical protein [Candidatus Bathyarchaeota archaeon]
MGRDELSSIPAAVFHTVLFAYQKALKDVLGSGHAALVPPVLTVIKKINEEYHVNLAEGETLNEAFDNLSRILVDTGIASAVSFEKLGGNCYKFIINDCVFADPTHRLLQPEDVTCPLAILAMVVYEKISGKKTKFTYSKYTEKGTETIIEPLP